MSRKQMYKGMKLKGWEVRYLKQAEKYGHLGNKATVTVKSKKQ